MNTHQLRAVLDKEGIPATVCAVDQLPMRVDTFPAAFIVNTDEHDEPGEHWVAIYFPSANCAEFFYSYGHLPSFFDERLRAFVYKANNVVYNTLCLQAPLFILCGQYCLFYIIHRDRGIDAETLLRHLAH